MRLSIFGRPTHPYLQKVDKDKVEVETYFEDTGKDGGFDRWKRIYGDGDDINSVQQDIREGHQITVDKVLWWFESDREPIRGCPHVMAYHTVYPHIEFCLPWHSFFGLAFPFSTSWFSKVSPP